MERDLRILEWREPVVADDTTGMGAAQRFSVNVLRPVLKAQNELFLAVFHNYAVRHKSEFFEHTPEKQLQFIANAIQRDIKFRNVLKGIIIAGFTIAEYNEYLQDSSALNKRMMSLLTERLQSQLQLLTQNTSVDDSV